MEIAAELMLGPYDGRTGFVTFKDEPPAQLAFSLADRDSASLTILATELDDELTAVYVRVEEKPRKVITYDDNGSARSTKGVRYRYSTDSPCERAFARADRHALLTSEAHESVMNTRRLLLEKGTS